MQGVRRDPIQEIIAFNSRFARRRPELMRKKIERLAASPFGFFRGTFHLFARDLLEGTLDPWRTAHPFTSVEIRLIGDIHTENYGTFKARDGLVHFDVNDFDETTTGGFDFDCKRAAASLFLAASQESLSWIEAVKTVAEFLKSYCQQIADFAAQGGAAEFGYNERQLPEAKIVRKLISAAAAENRTEFIEARTKLIGHHRQLERSDKFFELSEQERMQAERLLTDYVKNLGDAAKQVPGFYDSEDICGRVAGDGSLGRARYAVLLVGEGSREAKNVLLEFKESLPSAYDEYRGRETETDARCNRAANVVAVCRTMQTASNRHLGYAVDHEQSFQIREIGPRDRRIEWKSPPPHDDVQDLARLYGALLAKCHAKADAAEHAAGKACRSIAAALQGQVDVFIKRMTAFALAYSELVEDDYRRLCARRAEVENALVGAEGDSH
jgi:uncharacterized protein (DUF2252 family)